MADLGIYNYIRSARGRGETDDEILATLPAKKLVVGRSTRETRRVKIM